MLESAAQLYREAYARYKAAGLILGLAEIEADFGNVERTKVLLEELRPKSQELPPESVAALEELEKRLMEG